MSRWFRFYDDTLNDPKSLKLSDKTHRIWIGILCIASKNDGQLPPFEDMAILLRMKPAKLQPELEKLIKAELIDHDDNGLRPHNWSKRQYKSDVSTERVKRFRNGERNVSETPPETEADTESETEKKDSRAVAKATRPKTSEAFEEFWKAYPRRLGANPKAPAFKVFDAAIRQGADPPAIVEGARRCAAADRDKIGTPYIPQAVKWLRDQRWLDYAAAPPGPSDLSDDERKQMFEKLRKSNAETGCREGTDLRGAGVGAHQIEGVGRQGTTAGPDNPTRHAGMGRLAAVFREPPRLHAGSNGAGGDGDDEGQELHRAGQIARAI